MDNRIWRRDDFFPYVDRIDMDPGMVELPEDPIPLLKPHFRFDVKPVGQVTNVRLEDGEILGDVEFFDQDQEESLKRLADDLRLGGYYTNVLRNEAGDRIAGCTLRAVSFVLTSSGAHPYAKEN